MESVKYMETFDGQALPDGYAARMRRLLGEDGFFAYLRALGRPPERALRLNPLRCPDGAPLCPIEGLAEPVPWARGAYFVEGDARPGLSPLHEAGLFYMQEPSAMSAVPALDPQPGERVLDLCAAPGGKSTQIAALLGGRGLLVANEPVPSRAQILSRNVERMGVRNAVVTCAAPERLTERFPAFFDRVLVDAPCSGEGMFRRQIEAREAWSEAAAHGCAGRQREILTQAARMLAPGGVLVYSTCTFDEEENEGVIRAFLAAHGEFSPEPFALPGLPDAREGTLRLYPHEIRGEGHFVARLRKRQDAPSRAPEERTRERAAARGGKARGARADAKKAPPTLPRELREALAEGVDFSPLRLGESGLWLWPEGIEPQRLEGLRVLRAGLRLASAKGERFEPDHALALAMRPQEAARSAQLTREQALAYQAGETLALGDLPPGHTLLCFCGVPLGWGRQSDGVMKNRYPKGLRRR